MSTARAIVRRLGAAPMLRRLADVPEPGVFVLGLGAQKSGTTWLHRWLQGHDFANFGFTKEYHVWDALTLPAFQRERDVALERGAASIGRGWEDVQRSRQIKRLAFLAEPGMYFNYFAGLLARSDVRLTGDVTPAYSGLQTDTLRMIRMRFAKRGVRVRPVFLMRDPVMRLHSAVRAKRREAGADDDTDAEVRGMERLQGTEREALRSGYDATLERIDEVFGLQNAWIGVYEDLFGDATQTSLSRFLGMELSAPPVETRVNASPGATRRLTAEEYARFREGYAASIDRVQTLTGLDLSARWAFRG